MKNLISFFIISIGLFFTTAAIAEGSNYLDEPKLGAPTSANSHENLSPGAVGWGNLLVPGLGATLRDQPVQGLTEASLEIGSFYGGTLLAEEQSFKIDGSTSIPQNGSVGRAVSSQMFQQFGLKYHFYNTFYHYQQAAIAAEDTEREKNNPQPLYRGTWKDMLAAPFQWDNLKSTWTWPVVVAASAYLIYSYATTSVVRRGGRSISGADQGLFGVSQLASFPIGSSFGEDPLFRGFIQREMVGMTGSMTLAIATQASLFALLHDDRVTAFLVGSYFGVEANALHGNLGPIMAAHFWINVVSGVCDWLAFERSLGKNTPGNPPLIAQIQIPIY